MVKWSCWMVIFQASNLVLSRKALLKCKKATVTTSAPMLA